MFLVLTEYFLCENMHIILLECPIFVILCKPLVTCDLTEVERAVLEEFVSPYDLRRLELYATNMADYHLITDLLPAVARLFVLGRFGDCHLSPVQTVSTE